jgi:ribosomal protein S18 acetylase RimI-like enzyme
VLSLSISDAVGLSFEMCNKAGKKNYDAIPGNHPTLWAADRLVGLTVMCRWETDIVVAAVAVQIVKTKAIIWDIRVAPEMRGNGLGKRILAECIDIVVEAGVAFVEVETQNVNLAACQLYKSSGFQIACIDRYAYEEQGLDEIAIIWRREIYKVDFGSF